MDMKTELFWSVYWSAHESIESDKALGVYCELECIYISDKYKHNKQD